MIDDITNKTEALSINSYLTDIYKIRKGDKRILLRQLKPVYSKLLNVKTAFQNEIESGQSWIHKNILRYGPIYTEEGMECTVQMEIAQFVTLEDFLFEHPTFVVNRKELIRILKEVMEALEYLHSHGYYHLHLHPRNILLTKDSLTVKLINPIFFYLTCPLENLPSKDEFMAPELWFISKENIDLKKSEIYSYGKLTEYVFSTSTLPYSLRSSVKSATIEDVEMRLTSLDAFKKKSKRRQVFLLAYKVLAWICGIVLTCIVLYWGTTSSLEEDIHFVKPTADSIYVFDSISGEGYYLSDSMAMKQAEDASRALWEREQKYIKKTEDIFKKKFREKAIPVIDKIYSHNNMNSEEAVFTNVTLQGMNELQEVQKDLGAMYGLNELVSSQIAAEIIEELTRYKMSEYIKE